MIDKVIQSTTQQFLDIYDITNDLVIMKDGTTSLIISVDAMNFGLLAEEEQDGIMYAYASLLNSLNYPIQIVVRSQTKDVTGYLLLLREQEEITQNKLMRQRIRAYREFVANLIHERNVLDKKFYVCIPAPSIELGLLPPSTVLPGSKPFDISTIEKSVVLEKARNILEPKRDHLISQFARIGLFSRQLNSQEIIQLFYLSYNPEAAEGQQLADSSNYTTPLVSAGVEGPQMNTLPTQQVSPPAPTGGSPLPPTPAVSPTPPMPPATEVAATVEPVVVTPAPSSANYQPTQMPNRATTPSPVIEQPVAPPATDAPTPEQTTVPMPPTPPMPPAQPAMPSPTPDVATPQTPPPATTTAAQPLPEI